MVAPPSTPPTATSVLAGRAPRRRGGESADETDLTRVSWSPASHERPLSGPAGPVRDQRPSGAVGRSDAAHAAGGVELYDPRRGRRAGVLVVGEFPALPSETITTDIHCVTKWSKLDTSWRGVSLDTLLEAVDTSAGYHRVLSLDPPGR